MTGKSYKKEEEGTGGESKDKATVAEKQLVSAWLTYRARVLDVALAY